MPSSIGNNLVTLPVSSVASNNAGTGLQNIVFAAANTGASSISGAGPYALPTSKDAYYNLQQRAAQACFTDEGVRDFVLASAQKTNGQAKDASAVALLECAVNLYVIDPDLGSSPKMGQVKTDLTKLAERFQNRPARSIVTCDLRHPDRYNDYQKLKTQINELLASAPASVDRVFESVQSRIAQAYLVDGLRAGVEGSWGQLTAQSVQALMRNGNYSDAAGKVLAGQLKLAKASRNGDGLAELVRQSLKMLDLHRPGQAAGPGANNHTAPAAPSGVPIQHCLTCCHGHGHAPLSLTVNGGAGGSATNGLSSPELVRLVESLRRSGSDTQATNIQPVNNPPENIQPVNNPPENIQPENIPRENTQPENIPLVKIPRVTIQPDNIPRENIPRENTQPENIPNFELSNSLGGGAVRAPNTNHRHAQSTSNSSDPLRRGISSPDLQNVTELATKEQLLEKLKNGSADVKLNLNNMLTFSPKHVHFAAVTKLNAQSVSGAINLGVNASEEFVALKKLLLGDTQSWDVIAANEALQALREYNPAFDSRVARLIEAEKLKFASSSKYVPAATVDLTAGTNRYSYRLSAPSER